MMRIKHFQSIKTLHKNAEQFPKVEKVRYVEY